MDPSQPSEDRREDRCLQNLSADTTQDAGTDQSAQGAVGSGQVCAGAESVVCYFATV